MFVPNFSAFASVSSSIAQSESQNDYLNYAKNKVFEASISEISAMLKNGEITSKALCELYIERINAYDKDGVKLNSIISLNTNAIKIAEQLDLERSEGRVRGALHGIPILVKDNIDVSGFPTTLGYENKQTAAEESAEAVKLLAAEGAIILGKTSLSTGDTETRYTYNKLIGETRNVYDVSFSSGGSSGGCAVAVSANFAAASISTDTNSSLSYPAALNGVYALRPTHNLIDYTGAKKVNASRDVIAPVAKNVSDLSLILDVLTGSVKEQTYSKSLNKNSLNGKTLLIIKELSGYTYNNPNEFKKYDKEIEALFNSTKEKLESLGATVKEVSIPKLFTYYNNCRETIKGSDSAKANLLNELKNLLDKNNADAFIFPVYLSAPLKSGFDKYGDHLSASQSYLNCSGYLPSLVGIPAVTVPMGALECGISAGFEIVGLKNEEAKILSLAYSFEQNIDKRIVPETVPNLYADAKEPPKQQIEKEEQEISSQPQINKVEPSKPSMLWQNIAVVMIIISVLGFCVWLLVFGIKKDSKKDSHKNRNF